MNEDLKSHEGEAIDTIHLDQNYEVEAWCALFGITIPDLKHAVEAVGPSAVKVKYYLKQHNLFTESRLAL